MSFTPQYAAPEQFNPVLGATGPWTDVFALALVFVEVVTGRLPSDAQLARCAGRRLGRR
jgi:serine/threonine protein kinase